MKNKKTYICYLDLLGIKELARTSTEKYFATTEKFRNSLFICADEFEGLDQNITSVFYFSDCAFIETDDLERLFKFLQQLRKRLFFEEGRDIFFTAAVKLGSLGAVNFSGADNLPSNITAELSDLLEIVDRRKYLKGTIFQSKNVSEVYLLQTNFKGVGVFIDPNVIEAINKENINLFSDYVTEAFYYPNINSNNVQKYFDLKLETEIIESGPILKSVFQIYHKSNLKNKKYGRYYLSLVSNWISSSISNPNQFDNIEKYPIIYNFLVKSHPPFMESLRRSSHNFDYLYLFLLERLYNTFEGTSPITIELTSKLIKENLQLFDFFDLPDQLITPENKDRLVDELHLSILGER